MNDSDEDAVNDRKKGTEDYTGLHRRRPLYDSLQTACKTVYHPHQNLAVDERIVTKAKIGMKQYIKNEPKKCSIKLFVLADSNGYTVDFNILYMQERPKQSVGGDCPSMLMCRW